MTLSSDKIPPHYAFPELKWSLIPVEDFHGPAIRDIKKFLNIMDEARREGEVTEKAKMTALWYSTYCTYSRYSIFC